MRKRSLVVTLALTSLLTVSCSKDTPDPTSPTPINPAGLAHPTNTHDAPTPTTPVAKYPHMDTTPKLATCIKASDLPDWLTWATINAPENAKLDKGYFWDDTPGCAPTTQHGRTQNGHLKMDQTGTTITTVFNVKAVVRCYGRYQVDADVNRIGIVRLMIDNDTGPVCKKDEPLPEMPPTPEVPHPTPHPPQELPPPTIPEPIAPPAPLCEKSTAWENHRFNVTDPTRPIRAVATVHNGEPGTRWTLTLYADGLAVQKDSHVVGCENKNFRVEVDWRNFVDRNWHTTLDRDGVIVSTTATVTKP